MKLSRENYFKALGLWHLATEHARKAELFDKALNDVLGSEPGSHASDSIYCVITGDTLDDALERMGIEVVDEE